MNYRCEPPFHPDPRDPPVPPTNRKVYLVTGAHVSKIGGYTSWHSANAAYGRVSGATAKGYSNWERLRRAWHAGCDRGEHAHLANPDLLETWSPIASSSQVGPMPAVQSSAGHEAPISPPLRCFIINSRSPSPVAPPRSSDDPPPYAPAFPASTSRQPSDTADVYAIRIGRQGEIFHSAAEARARFKALERAGSVAGFVISSSVDNCIAWINSAPSDAEVRAVENVQWASDDETDELRIANVSLEE
ncbi:hypothetical protein B0H13DRAFT_2380831 [Mycena leptocephala]|nr:hypothetical protein B0H13DRAFT_2380831 [Mycena leptocephala]